MDPGLLGRGKGFWAKRVLHTADEPNLRPWKSKWESDSIGKVSFPRVFDGCCIFTCTVDLAAIDFADRRERFGPLQRQRHVLDSSLCTLVTPSCIEVVGWTGRWRGGIGRECCSKPSSCKEPSRTRAVTHFRLKVRGYWELGPVVGTW